MQILVETGDYKCGNMGDLAMLQVAVRRLRALWPDARIRVFTSAPDALLGYCPDVEPVSRRGRSEWYSDRFLLGRLSRITPSLLSRRVEDMTRSLRRSRPSALRSLLRLRSRLARKPMDDIEAFLQSLADADLVVASGQGGMNDHVIPHSLSVLNLLETSLDSGKPTVLFSQGLGPISDPILLARARAVLPRASLIALREGLSSLSLVQKLGVDPEKVLVCGDDAVELAYTLRSSDAGSCVGVNVRAASSAEVTEASVKELPSIIASFSRKTRASVIPVPISRHHDFRDATSIHNLFNEVVDSADGGKELDSAEKVIRQVSKCRLVVTGAYHAAVFALAQGIPAVCLARSQYFIDKFQGLAHEFGPGCQVVLLRGERLPSEQIREAMHSAWSRADELRTPLLSAAERQITLGRAAYAKTFQLVTGHEPSPMWTLAFGAGHPASHGFQIRPGLTASTSA